MQNTTKLILFALAVGLVGCADGEILRPTEDTEGLENGGEIGGEVPGDDTPAQDDEGLPGDEPVDENDVPPPVEDPCTAECKFTTYNLDVRTGDTFVLARFLECADPLPSHTFVSEGPPWRHLDAINAGEPITITEEDRAGGDHGPGEYRLSLIEDASGDEVDHVTIRIDHDDVSDIGPNDAAPVEAGVCSAQLG